jgi:LmbE family N-acetylglucosaminyl deacetylase
MTMSSLPSNKIQLARLGLSDLGKLSVLELGTAERILVLAPHPDDESLAAGGVIASLRQDKPKSEIRVIIVTNGDASYTTSFFHGSHGFTTRHFQSIALERQQESLSALKILGLAPSQIHFWGFPDRGLLQLRKKHWSRQESYRSPTTGFCWSEQAINSPSLQYNGMNLLHLIQNQLMTFRPTMIIFPHPQDPHPDHKTLALLTVFATGIQYIRQTAPQMLAYMMWSGNTFWMTGSFFNENTKTAFPKSALREEWKLFPLSKSVQQKKAVALTCYGSQNFATGQILRAGTKNPQELFELFAPIPPTP